MSKMHVGYELTSVECEKCSTTVNTVEKDNHDSKCTGLHILQCPCCLQMFSNKHQKAAHKKKHPNGACRAASVVNTTNSINIGNQNIGTQIIIQGGGDALQRVLDFASTQNSTQIILHLQGNPAEIQIAHKLGDTTLHQALTSISHYTGPLETRNITRFDTGHSVFKVISDGVPTPDRVSRVLDTVEKRNRAIANDPAIKPLLTKDVNEVMLPMPTTDKAWKDQRKATRLVMEGRGRYNSLTKERIPTYPPEPELSLKETSLMVVDAMSSMPVGSLRMVEYNKDLEQALQDIFVAACNQYTYVGGEWFTSVTKGTGWMLCDTAPKKIKDHLHSVQQHAIDKLLTLKNETPPGPEFDHLRSMSDCLCRFNIEPSLQDVMDIIVGS